MKQLNFIGSNETNLYHTLKRKEITVDGNIIKGKALITGFSRQEIEINDVMYINNTSYLVTNIIERRDHKGLFTNDEDNKNAFFSVECKFEEVISQSK